MLLTVWTQIGFSKGKYIKLFEDSFADYIGVDYACAVSNGTVALHTALLALGVSAGDEVLVPSLHTLQQQTLYPISVQNQYS